MSRRTTGNRQERDAVKHCLQQYHTAQQKKRILEERRRTLSAELRGPSANTAFRSAHASRPAEQDCAGEIVLKIAEIEERIEKQRAAMTKAVLRVMNLIELLPVESIERTVVEMRHIDGKSWDQIAGAVYLSRSAVFNYYNSALTMLLGNDKAKELVKDYQWRSTGKSK